MSFQTSFEGITSESAGLQDANPTIRPYSPPPPPIPTALPSLTAKFFPGEICISRCPNFSFFPRCDVHIGLWGSSLGQSSPKWEKTCYAPIPVIVPNFIPVVQTVYKKSVTKNLLRLSQPYYHMVG